MVKSSGGGSGRCRSRSKEGESWVWGIVKPGLSLQYMVSSAGLRMRIARKRQDECNEGQAHVPAGGVGARYNPTPIFRGVTEICRLKILCRRSSKFACR